MYIKALSRILVPITSLLLVGVVVFACKTPPEDVQATFFKAEAGYTATLQAAAAYVSLPRCPQATAICSKQDVVDAIRPAANSADAAVQSAEDLIRQHPNIDAQFAIAAVQAAIQNLTNIMVTYHVGGL